MIFKVRFKGGPGSGHHGHSGIPGKQGGSLPGTGGNNFSLSDYHDAPSPEPPDRDIRKFMSGKGPATMYHVTDYAHANSIAKHGLVPGASSATGQDWKAVHSDYATYFHVGEDGWRSNVDDIDDIVGYKPLLVVGTPERTHDLALRILPDEDAYSRSDQGLKAYNETSSIALIGGLRNDEFLFVYDADAPKNDIASLLETAASHNIKAITYEELENL